MNKIIKFTALLLSSLFSVTTFAHPGHGNNNVFHTHIFHSHDGNNYLFVMSIVILLIGIASYYAYKKYISK